METRELVRLDLSSLGGETLANRSRLMKGSKITRPFLASFDKPESLIKIRHTIDAIEIPKYKESHVRNFIP